MRLTRFQAGFDGLLAAGGQAIVGATAQVGIRVNGESQRLVRPVGQPAACAIAYRRQFPVFRYVGGFAFGHRKQYV
jgi:hypothetical protein